MVEKEHRNGAKLFTGNIAGDTLHLQATGGKADPSVA